MHSADEDSIVMWREVEAGSWAPPIAMSTRQAGRGKAVSSGVAELSRREAEVVRRVRCDAFAAALRQISAFDLR